MTNVRVMIALKGDVEAKRVALEASLVPDSSKFKAAYSPTKILAGLEIDPDFIPIPLESVGRTPMMAMSTAEAATTHIVRGEISRSKIAALAEQDDVTVFSDPRIETISTDGCADAPIGDEHDVRRLIGTAALHAANLDGRGVAIAICDTGINEAHLSARGVNPLIDKNALWSPPGVAAKPGRYKLDHGTMCAHATKIAAPAATLIDIPLLQSTSPGGSAMDGFLSDGVSAYAFLRGLIQQGRYQHLVVNNSWGMYELAWDFPAGNPGRYADNPMHPFNLACAALARAGADILFAAGNCGPTCPDGRCSTTDSHTITGANAHPDVTTVSGVSVNGKLIGYSSRGPGIPGMATQKPDISCYTHYLGSETYGTGSADSGTSTACPVAAGMVAALRSSSNAASFRPSDLARELRFDAISRRTPTRWSKTLGYGIMNALGTSVRLGL